MEHTSQTSRIDAIDTIVNRAAEIRAISNVMEGLTTNDKLMPDTVAIVGFLLEQMATDIIGAAELLGSKSD